MPSTATNLDHPQLPVAGELHKLLLGGVVFCVFYFPVMSIYLPVWLFRCREGPYLPSRSSLSLSLAVCAVLSFLSVVLFLPSSVVGLIVVLFSPVASFASFGLYSETNKREQARAGLDQQPQSTVDRPSKHNTTALQFPVWDDCGCFVLLCFVPFFCYCHRQ